MDWTQELSRFEELMQMDQHDPEVQCQIGKCYLRGEGVEPDAQQAAQWLQRAAEGGNQEARELLKPKKEETGLTGPIEWAALPLWCAAAEEGDREAQYRVAQYLEEQDFPEGRDDVIRYLRMAEAQGNGMAGLKLGERLLESNPEEAVRHLKNAADCAVVEAMKLLGECYFCGRGVPADPKQAEDWYKLAAERGSAEDKLELALRYHCGDNVDLSPIRAGNWVKQAMLAGMENADERFHAERKKLDKKKRREEKERMEQERLAKEQEQKRKEKEAREKEEEARKKEEDERKAQERIQKNIAAMENEQKRLRNEGRQIKKVNLGAKKFQDEEMMAGNLKPKNNEFSQYSVRGKQVDGYKRHYFAPSLSTKRRETAMYERKLLERDYDRLLKTEHQMKSLENAVSNKNIHAQWILGRFYFYGSETPFKIFRKDHKAAFNLFYGSARNGSINGQYWLGMYYAEQGRKKGPGEYLDHAEYWWISAASQGHKGALEALNKCVYALNGRVMDIQDWPFER